MTSILHNKIGMQSGDTQGHDVRGHAEKDKKHKSQLPAHE